MWWWFNCCMKETRHNNDWYLKPTPRFNNFPDLLNHFFLLLFQLHSSSHHLYFVSISCLQLFVYDLMKRTGKPGTWKMNEILINVLSSNEMFFITFNTTSMQFYFRSFLQHSNMDVSRLNILVANVWRRQILVVFFCLNLLLMWW